MSMHVSAGSPPRKGLAELGHRICEMSVLADSARLLSKVIEATSSPPAGESPICYTSSPTFFFGYVGSLLLCAGFL